VELPRLYLAWLTPAMFAEGDADLDLATDLLANGKTSRLYRRLVFEERLAADGPTDEEIERGRVQAEAQFMFRLQTVGGFGGKSDQLNAYNVFLHDPAYFDRDLARYQVVTHTSLQDVVRRHLDPARRVTLSIVPHGRTALAAPGSAMAA